MARPDEKLLAALDACVDLPAKVPTSAMMKVAASNSDGRDRDISLHKMRG
jgi:hypothetical protein